MNRTEGTGRVLDNPTTILALCGAVTGVLNASFMQYDVESTKYLFGAFFGLAVAAALVKLKLASVIQSILILATFAVSWVAAYQAAIEWSDSFEELYQVGFPAGALGAGIVASGFAMIFPSARRPLMVLRTISIGAIAGLLLGMDSPYYLFVIWQAAIGASLGAGVSRVTGNA